MPQTITTQYKITIGLLLIGLLSLYFPVREAGHSKELAKCFGRLAQTARSEAWSDAASEITVLQSELRSIQGARLVSHWSREQGELVEAELIAPLQYALQRKLSARSQEAIAGFSAYCTQCHLREGRADLPIRKRPTATNIIGE